MIVAFDVAFSSKLPLVRPVIEQLIDRGHECLIIQTGTVNANAPLDMVPFERVGVPVHSLLPIGPAAEFGSLDWHLYLMWLRRNAPRLLQHYSIDVLVTLNDRTYPCNFFVSASRELGIPCLLLQEALRKDEILRLKPREWLRRTFEHRVFGIESRLRPYGTGGATTIAAWGDTSRDYLVRVGVPAERIAVTGNPALDSIATTDWRPQAQAVGRELDISEDETAILFLPSRLAAQGLVAPEALEARIGTFLSEFSEASRAAPRPVKLVVRTKPGVASEVERYAAALKDHDLGDRAVLAPTQPLYPLLARCDASIMFSTTAGLEAALFGKPVGALDVGRALDNWGFVEAGVALPLHDTADLTEFVQLAGDRSMRTDAGKRAREAANRYVAHVGEATKRVTDLVIELHEGSA